MHPLPRSARPLAAAVLAIGLSGQALAMEITSTKQAVIFQGDDPQKAASQLAEKLKFEVRVI